MISDDISIRGRQLYSEMCLIYYDVFKQILQTALTEERIRKLAATLSEEGRIHIM